MRKRRAVAGAIPMALASLVILAATSCAVASLVKPPGGSRWQQPARNPIIRMGDAVKSILWNDPAVLKEDGGYRMWLSGGDPRNLDRIVVKVYEATSPDGMAWTIRPRPVLEPSADPRLWDSLRIETPAVVKAKGAYHLYYSGCDEANCREGVYAVGHATSADGRVWRKDPANPILRAQSEDRFAWGYRGVGEPGVLFDEQSGMFYLYYTSMRFSRERKGVGLIGILLATSRDGSTFSNVTDSAGGRRLILTRDIPTATDGAWFGYTTPSPVKLKNDDIRLFCSFIVAPEGPATARHVTLVEAAGRDFMRFEVLDENVFEAGHLGWIDHQVRSPTVIEDQGEIKMWFAGETRRPFFGAGIGYAVRPLDTPSAPGRRPGRSPAGDASR